MPVGKETRDGICPTGTLDGGLHGVIGITAGCWTVVRQEVVRVSKQTALTKLEQQRPIFHNR